MFRSTVICLFVTLVMILHEDVNKMSSKRKEYWFSSLLSLIKFLRNKKKTLHWYLYHVCKIVETMVRQIEETCKYWVLHELNQGQTFIAMEKPYNAVENYYYQSPNNLSKSIDIIDDNCIFRSKQPGISKFSFSSLNSSINFEFFRHEEFLVYRVEKFDETMEQILLSGELEGIVDQFFVDEFEEDEVLDIEVANYQESEFFIEFSYGFIIYPFISGVIFHFLLCVMALIARTYLRAFLPNHSSLYALFFLYSFYYYFIWKTMKLYPLWISRKRT